MGRKRVWSVFRRLTRRQRRVGQAALVGLSVTASVFLLQWMGLFSSLQASMPDFLYETHGDPGDDIVIVAIDEPSVQALGEWPWSLDLHVRLFNRLREAGAVGFDVLLTDPGPEGNVDTPALLEATRLSNNVVVPVAALELYPPSLAGELYSIGRAIPTFPGLQHAAAGVGSVNHILDRDGTLRRVPLLVNVDEQGSREAFSLQVLRQQLGLGDAPAVLKDRYIAIEQGSQTVYQVPCDANGVMLVNFAGGPNTFPTYSFVDVIDDRIDPAVFENRIVLVGVMNMLAEMDLHRTPVSAQRMAGVEFMANVIHTLYHHRALVPQRRVGTMLVVVIAAMVSALVLSQLGATLGAVVTLLLGAAYLVFAGFQFNAGVRPNVFFPLIAILITYPAVMGTRFAIERAERNRVTDVFGRFVSPEVRDAIVSLALENPELVHPGGRQVEISVLFADIRGFTTISESLSPTAVVEILNQYLESMEAEVFMQGGTLDKYTGDGMMVLFGAPLEQADHAQRAVRAAVAMQRAAAEVSERRKEDDYEIAYGIGITTGPAVVGHIGSSRRLDYTAIGDTVNLAARLEGIAPPGEIYVDQSTYEAVQSICMVQELPPVSVKGKTKSVPVYAIQGVREGSIVEGRV